MIRKDISVTKKEKKTIMNSCQFYILIFLLQLDANLIEGEPYYRLAWKNKDVKMWRDKIQISELWENGFNNPPRWTASVWGPVRCCWHTDFFIPAHPPVGQKMSLLTIWTALVHDIHLMTKKYVCMVKDKQLQNQSIRLDLYWCCDETYEGEG